MTAAIPIASIAGFVLAGGQSTRMGRDKALVELAGKPLILYALETLRDAGISAQIAGARSDLSAFAPVIPDATPDSGPLSGICSALASTQAEWAVFLSVDMPLLPAALVRTLVAGATQAGSIITQLSLSGLAETFPAVVHRTAFAHFQNELQTGRASCRDAYQAAALAAGQHPRVLAAESFAQPGLQPERWFCNVNSPEALAQAERYLAESRNLDARQ